METLSWATKRPGRNGEGEIMENLVRIVAIWASINCILWAAAFVAYLPIYAKISGTWLHYSDAGVAALVPKVFLSIAGSSGIIAAISGIVFVINKL